MTDAAPPILVEERPDRTIVRMNRPHARNAINAAMLADLHEVCARLEAHPKPLLLTGTDGMFAAGADLRELLARERDDAFTGVNHRLFERIRRLPMPTMAAVDGFALGGGAELAYACDIRLASTRARFGNPEPRLGIVAGAGACWRLTELVGEPTAKLVLLAGRELDAAGARECGLVAEVTEPGELLSAAHRLIDAMADLSPMALRLTKLLVDAPGAHPAADQLAQAVLFDDDDKRRRMRAFLDRRRSS